AAERALKDIFISMETGARPSVEGVTLPSSQSHTREKANVTTYLRRSNVAQIGHPVRRYTVVPLEETVSPTPEPVRPAPPRKSPDRSPPVTAPELQPTE